MIKKFKNFNIPIDTSGSMSMSDFGTRRMTKAEIYEVDNIENKNRTYKKITVSFNELKQLIDLKLVFIDDDYVFLKDNRETIKDFLELERNAKKYNL